MEVRSCNSHSTNEQAICHPIAYQHAYQILYCTQSCLPQSLQVYFNFYSTILILVRICTQRAQQDLRFEENIDAFSMSGQHGRSSPILKIGSDENGKCLFIHKTKN
jgi:hypothetical protein